MQATSLKTTVKRGLSVGALALAVGSAAQAQVTLPDITLGAGLRTSFTHTDVDGDGRSSDFAVESIRLYLSGSVTDEIKFTFNTDYNDDDSEVKVIDAIARFEYSDTLNVWMGRFLPPSDRSNLYGPYYANHWGVYSDGVQDGYPFKETGRSDGIAWWGHFGGVANLSLGVFDVPSTQGSNDLVMAGRVHLAFWDPEPGYYLNGTYYGDKDILSVGLAGQFEGSDRALTGDFLLEKNLGGVGVVTLEAQVSRYDGLGGYDPNYELSEGWYVLGAYLFPEPVGPGRFQLLAKYGEADFKDGITPIDDSYTWKTTEFNLNYIIKDFNARLSLFYKDVDFTAVHADYSEAGFGVQLQF